ncbi:MAG: hypothetical protein RI960_1306, partial [Pseudomonadota bacterium]
MSMPLLNYPITPIKLIDQPNKATQINGPLKNNSSHNSVTESPLTVLHQSLSTSNGAYPNTQRPRAQGIADRKFNDANQSSSSVINEIDDESTSTSAKESNPLKKSAHEEQSTSVVITEVDDESTSTSAKEPLSQSSLDKLHLLKKQLKTANRNNNEKETEKIQRQIDALTRESESPKSNAERKKISPYSNKNIDGTDPAPLNNKRNSSLLSPEKLKHLVETVDRNKINKIDGLIQGLKNKADQLEEKIKKLNKIIED